MAEPAHPRLFVSYAHRDGAALALRLQHDLTAAAFALRLKSDLERRGHKLWFDPK